MCGQCCTDQSSPRANRRAVTHAAANRWSMFGVGDEKPEKWVPKVVTGADAGHGSILHSAMLCRPNCGADPRRRRPVQVMSGVAS
ncbi:Uncharacterised protein [Mycobacteroides abscessus subsp. abscessus]|nr:Uncharacterised protein [Mycobacteroides abscessus subsp. abscessus]SIG44371.1 Uncharacterised protein [Mycobacteroides abscessus subsp. abscessus]SIN15271.1 Uncharacterised protein [Mycobacteroides abscessus subsp. abscessus]SLJ01856.1 Uncharacterised protein [Mycobacteroides abscessus subsp. abscessus]SLJ19504.1 Uncharacterised protein [Mycobacteroides abscessus subsp. abscessus]